MARTETGEQFDFIIIGSGFGGAVSTNLGVNPSLTITALSERFASQFPTINSALIQERQVQFSTDQAKPHHAR
jgi:choline dehydrogenase-like flavoprotein